MTSSSSNKIVCFNSNCKEPSEKWRKGWRRRTGDQAQLCERCASVYEEGKFCETFHLSASGWRCCESCGKQIHCGCIVSFHMFVLLDAGGIECLTCTKKSYILTPNPAWPTPPHSLTSQPERMKSWSSICGSGPVPWHQAPSLLNGSKFQSDLQQKSTFETNLSGGIDRFKICEKLPNASFPDNQESNHENLVNGKSRVGPISPFEITVQNGNSVQSKDFRPTVFAKNDSLTLNSNLAAPFSAKQVLNPSGVDPPGEVQARNGKGRGKGQLLPRYRPQITNEELQQISSNSNSVITPLFEKMLSASDAGRIGRLVLPKKCAEAYFPPIVHPEGVPLPIQDIKGKEWVFQFRFWPNNNSRMYVLEGITPCIQSMQLQAGDVVTFSRLDGPEGKLVMGSRKASSTMPSSDQGDEAALTGTDASVPGDDNAKTSRGEIISRNGQNKEKILDPKPTIRSKRKNSILSTKSKRLQIENEDSMELKLTWKEVQVLMRPPHKIAPSVVNVEGFEIEEFEEGEPVIGRPTIPATDHLGEKIQWVQCENCCKWRKVPVDALLPSRWMCSENLWDPERSQCSAAEELSREQLENMLLDIIPTVPLEKKDSNLFTPSLEGLDALANLAIEGEGGNCNLDSSNTRTKHPRHKPGCTCIVCLQPPSGKGSKHDQSCECVVCSSLKRRFKTLMERREKKLLEKEAQNAENNNSMSPNREEEMEKIEKDVQNAENNNNMTLNGEEEMEKFEKEAQNAENNNNMTPNREEEMETFEKEAQHSENNNNMTPNREEEMEKFEKEAQHAENNNNMNREEEMEKLEKEVQNAGNNNNMTPNREEEMEKFEKEVQNAENNNMSLNLEEEMGKSPLKSQIDLNIQPEREEESSPGSDSGNVKHLLAVIN